MNGIRYYIDYEKTEVEEVLINEKIGTVKFNVCENVHKGSYGFGNWEDIFLEVGTEIYSVKGESNAIAVKRGNNYYVYRSDMYEQEICELLAH